MTKILEVEKQYPQETKERHNHHEPAELRHLFLLRRDKVNDKTECYKNQREYDSPREIPDLERGPSDETYDEHGKAEPAGVIEKLSKIVTCVLFHREEDKGSGGGGQDKNE